MDEVDAKLALGLLMIGALLYLAYVAYQGIESVEQSVSDTTSGIWGSVVGVVNSFEDSIGNAISEVSDTFGGLAG